MQSDFVEKLPVELSPEQQRTKGIEMAELRKQHADVTAEMKEKAEDYKATLKALDRRIDDRAAEVRTGIEHRLVQCTERGRYRELLVDVVRLDTGEIVRTRPMTETEKQQALPFGTEHQQTRQ